MRSIIPTILLTFAFVAFETANVNADTPKSGKTTVSIKSGDGLSGYQDIMAAKTPKPIPISADLYMPKACGSEKMAAVIIQHGSGSPENPWYPKLAKELNKNGIIAIVPNSFKARGLSATGKDQSKLSKATRLFDTFSTFKYLQGLSCVDPNRVGLTGYSFGGIISIDSVEEALASRLGNGFVYKATLPVYPSCQASFENTKSTKTKVHILAGSADDFTPAKYCVEGVKVKQGKGWDIQITLLDGAHHGFNNDYPPKKNPNSWTFGDCGALSIDADGYEVSRQHNASTRSGWGTFVKTMAKKCGRKGVTVGGTDAFAAKTLDFTVRYFKENL
jgi:dienelactone hydrolase